MNIKRFSRRLLVYLGLLLVNLSTFIEQGFLKPFNQDEYQHIYLAWAGNNFGEVIFRDHFDNHGFIHLILNRLWLTLFNPAPGLDALLSLRLLALLLFLANLLILFELFWRLSGDLKHILLLPFLLLYSSIVMINGFEIRPDIIQNIFQNLSLLCLLNYFKNSSRLQAVLSGAFACLMIFTGIKSLITLLAILAGLFAIWIIFKKSRTATKTLLVNFSTGFSAIGIICVTALYYYSALENYLKYCLSFNFLIATRYNNEASQVMQGSRTIYLGNNLNYSLIVLLAFFFWLLLAGRKNLSSQKIKIMIAASILTGLAGKYFGLWHQYDLIFLFLLAGILSWFICAILQQTYSFAKKQIESLSPCSRISFGSYLRSFFIRPTVPYAFLAVFLTLWGAYNLYFTDWRKNSQYFDSARLNYLKLSNLISEGETVEAFTSACPGFGFYRHASYLIMKNSKHINTYYHLEKEDSYSRNYPRLLETNKVKILHGSTEILSLFSRDVQNYISANYTLNNCYWVRRTPFNLSPVFSESKIIKMHDSGIN